MFRSSLFWLSATRLLLRKRRHFVMQTARTDCGVASVLTVLNLMGRKGDPVAAVDRMDPDRSGSNLDAMRRYVEEVHGLTGKALSLPAAKLGQVKGRIVLHMRQMHYVVLLKRSSDGVFVFDPAMGPVFYPMADFAKLYSGYALAITKPARGAEIPAQQEASEILGGRMPRGLEPLALFIMGVASRLLECAILLCIVAALFLVLNRASFTSILMVFVILALCGGILLLARKARLEGEEGWAKKRQRKLWRGLLRTALGGRDLNGFRGRMEKDVAGSVRRGMIMSIPQRAQIPAALGSVIGLTALLCVLNPFVALAYLALVAGTLIVVQLDDVQICRLSVRPGIGRYSKLGLGRSLINARIGPDLIGQIAKWVVIGVAGFSVLLSDLPPVALMFWILTAMQIVPLDFRRVGQLSMALVNRDALSGLTASQVPLRAQKVGGPVDLKVSVSGAFTRIDGIAPLTATLQQPDLTVREQRVIMGDVVRHTLANLPEDARPEVGPVRIFAQGQEATQADFEQLMIARETRSGQNLPAVKDTRKSLEAGVNDPVLRDLHSCAPGDLPVFWDFRGRLKPDDIKERMLSTGHPQAAHLTMKRLTLVKAA